MELGAPVGNKNPGSAVFPGLGIRLHSATTVNPTFRASPSEMERGVDQAPGHWCSLWPCLSPSPGYRENQLGAIPASLSENEEVGEYDCVKCHTVRNFGEV